MDVTVGRINGNILTSSTCLDGVVGAVVADPFEFVELDSPLDVFSLFPGLDFNIETASLIRVSARLKLLD